LAESYTYDLGDKMLTAGAKSYTYDAAGRTVGINAPGGTTTLTYDYESRVTAISGPGINETHSYSGLDTRVGTVQGGVSRTFVRDGSYVTDPVLRDGQATFTPGVSERRGGVSTWSHSGLKNADAQTTSVGAIAATRVYDAFGAELSATGTWKGPFGYAGGFGYQEDSSGLKLLGHRYYDPTTGRFLSRDRAKDGRNWYIYCDNNPLNASDPRGLAKVYVAWRKIPAVEEGAVAGAGGYLIGGHIGGVVGGLVRANHVYLIIEDEKTGEVWTVGGGPEHQDRPWNFGKIVDRSGPANEDNFETLGSRKDIPANAILIRDDELRGQEWYDKAHNIGEEIEAADLPYDPASQNSNSFLYTVLARAGLLDEWESSDRKGELDTNAGSSFPGGRVWTPGWGKILPRQ
jgi:RHS repeat-associated protein